MNGENSNEYILDAFAILAYLENEAGAVRVQEYFETAKKGDCVLSLSIINMGEVLYSIERERGLEQAHEALSLIKSLPISLLSVDEQVVLAAAHIKANYRISYSDAFAATSTQMRQGKLITGDPEFEPLEKEKVIVIDWLPRK